MVMTDPLADMLTRVRNGYSAGHRKVVLPSSRLKVGVAKVLKAKGYIDAYKFEEDDRQGILTIHLRYDADDQPMIRKIERISRPGLRRYSKSGSIPPVLQGLGIMILSTNKGVMADDRAREENVGGELLCLVW